MSLNISFTFLRKNRYKNFIIFLVFEQISLHQGIQSHFINKNIITIFVKPIGELFKLFNSFNLIFNVKLNEVGFLFLKKKKRLSSKKFSSFFKGRI